MDEDPGRYGRVTGAQRYAKVVEVAEHAVDRLVADFDVTVEDVDLTPLDGEVRRGVRITPRNAGASMQFLITTFPGVWVTFGAQAEEGFPNCGCDGCDEDPEEVAAELVARIDAVVRGHFRETRRGYEFTFDSGSTSSESGRVVRPEPVDYEAWPASVPD